MGTRFVETGITELAPDFIGVTLKAAWRGEVSRCAITDSNGEIQSYKVKVGKSNALHAKNRVEPGDRTTVSSKTDMALPKTGLHASRFPLYLSV